MPIGLQYGVYQVRYFILDQVGVGWVFELKVHSHLGYPPGSQSLHAPSTIVSASDSITQVVDKNNAPIHRLHYITQIFDLGAKANCSKNINPHSFVLIQHKTLWFWIKHDV